jgi:hypothetical protein
MSKDPSDLGVDLCIAQLFKEGTVKTTCPWMHPYGHFSLMERLDSVAGGPHPSTLLTAPAARPHVGDVAYKGPFGPNCIASWVGGQGNYP